MRPRSSNCSAGQHQCPPAMRQASRERALFRFPIACLLIPSQRDKPGVSWHGPTTAVVGCRPTGMAAPNAPTAALPRHRFSESVVPACCQCPPQSSLSCCARHLSGGVAAAGPAQLPVPARDRAGDLGGLELVDELAMSSLGNRIQDPLAKQVRDAV